MDHLVDFGSMLAMFVQATVVERDSQRDLSGQIGKQNLQCCPVPVCSSDYMVCSRITANCSTEGANENFPIWGVFKRFPIESLRKSRTSRVLLFCIAQSCMANFEM
jgi:hypothetical protein